MHLMSKISHLSLILLITKLCSSLYKALFNLEVLLNRKTVHEQSNTGSFCLKQNAVAHIQFVSFHYEKGAEKKLRSKTLQLLRFFVLYGEEPIKCTNEDLCKAPQETAQM